MQLHPSLSTHSLTSAQLLHSSLHTALHSPLSQPNLGQLYVTFFRVQPILITHGKSHHFSQARKAVLASQWVTLAVHEALFQTESDIEIQDLTVTVSWLNPESCNTNWGWEDMQKSITAEGYVYQRCFSNKHLGICVFSAGAASLFWICSEVQN